MAEEITAEQKKIDPDWYWGLGYRHAEGAAEHGEETLRICRYTTNHQHN